MAETYLLHSYELHCSNTTVPSPLYSKLLLQVLMEERMATTMTTTIEEEEEEEDCQLQLPYEITTEILSRLSTKTVIQCKRVCKTWRALIVDPVFIHLHTHRFIISLISDDQESATTKNHTVGFFVWTQLDTPWTINDCEPPGLFGECFGEYNDDDEKISNSFKLSRLIITSQKCQINWTFMNSCNGLIFMATLHKDDTAICNPFTREFVDIPSGFTTTEDKCEYFRNSGFGYNPSTNEYKIVVVSYKDRLRGPGKVSVYTLGSRKWRDKGETSYVLGGWINIAPSLHLNGAVYWVNRGVQIVSFDLETEEFRLIPSPPLLQGMHHERLGSLGGCLYVIRKRSDVHNYCDVLVRNKEDYTWSKKFSITNEKLCSDCKPLAILKSGKILWYSAHGSKPYVVYYDPETGSLEMDENFIPFKSWIGIIHYEKSFVSLKALGEMNARIYDFEEYTT